MRTNVVEVIMNPLPIGETDSVFYAVGSEDKFGNFTYDASTVTTSFGMLDYGSLILTNGKTGVTYYLVHEDHPESYLDTTRVLHNGDLVHFDILKSDSTAQRQLTGDDVNLWGDGMYYIVAVDDTTGCSSTIGDMIFVDEPLIAYDAYIFLNKGEMSSTISLVPDYGKKGNRKYIEWNTKLDKVFLPVYYSESGKYYIDNDLTRGLNYGSNTGYTNSASDANIMFQLVPYSDSSIVHTNFDYLSGSVGMVNLDDQISDNIVKTATNTGWFQYTKKPSFYGEEKISYYIYNRKMPNLRYSNTATITILAGNEETGDTTSVFLIPNAFSPNGDGLNDVFKIIIPDYYRQNSESKLEVFNRWGTLVYRSSGMQYGLDCPYWDGTSSSSNMVTLGKNLPSGTYYYVFTITFVDDNDKAVKAEKKMNGYIELRR